MSSEVGNSLRVPNFLTASTPKELMRLMLRNNLKNGKEYNYDILHDGSKWFAWFREVVAVVPFKGGK